MEKMEMTEISIPVPWGIIAGYTVGDPKHPPVLCSHGIQDNCNSFFQLLPLLPTSFYYVCIDLPGHGKSSNFSAGTYLDILMYSFSIKRIVDHFGWEKMYYLGHSVSGTIGHYFAFLYPQHVVKLISIDAYFPKVYKNEELIKRMKDFHSLMIKIEKQISGKQPPTYSVDDFVKKMLTNRKTHLTPNLAKNMVQRSLVEVEPKRYMFQTDWRLKIGLPVHLEKDLVKYILNQIQCPILLIEAMERNLENSMYPLDNTRFYQKILLQKSNVVFHIVKGDHDVHILHPERLVSIITSFLLTQISHL
uniref:AB hydrolase-1 domain-containing protein n=1 Tax=Clastoptera arizonana TaxID=38151 RepID=A0A1B6E840_9HEMI